jgi:hypothetical protein
MMTCLGRNPPLVRVKAAGVGNWDALIREGKIELQPCLLFSVLSYQESLKRSERKSRGSKLATKYTGQQTSNSPERTQNMRCLRPE